MASFNRMRRSEIADTVSEEDYLDMLMRQRDNEARAFQQGQARQQGMVGSATRQLGDSLEKSTRNFVDSFGKGQGGAKGFQGLQQGRRDGIRDEDDLKWEFEQYDRPAQDGDSDFRGPPRSAMNMQGQPPAAQDRIVEQDIGPSAPPPQPPRQDMTTLEGRGEYFRNLEERPNYRQMSEPAPNMTPAAPPPAPNQSQMQPRGFGMSGPQGYTTPDRNYSPGAADVLDGRAQPGYNPGEFVGPPTSARPQPQLPLTEEEMAAEELKKKESTAVETRFGNGQRRELSPEEQMAVEESWRQHYQSEMPEEAPRLSDMALLAQTSNHYSDSGADRPFRNRGLTNRGALRLNNQLHQFEKRRATELGNFNMMYGAPLTEKDRLDMADKEEERAWRRELRGMDREDKAADRAFKIAGQEFEREKWQLEREKAKAAAAGLTDTDDISEDGYKIYADKNGKEYKGQIKVKEKPSAAVVPSYILKEDDQGGYVGVNTKNPRDTVPTGVKAPKKPEKPALTPAEQRKRAAMVKESTDAATALGDQLKFWQKLQTDVEKYNKGSIAGTGWFGKAGQATGLMSQKMELMDSLFKEGSFEALMKKSPGLSRLFDTENDRKRYEDTQPNIGMDNDVIREKIKSRIQVLMRDYQRAQAAAQESKLQLEEGGAAPSGGGRKRPEDMTTEELEAELRGN